MKTKKLLADLLSFTMIAATLATPLGGTINGVLDNFSLSANAETSGDYEYDVLDDGTVVITKYTGSDTELEIPSEIDGKKVTSIGYEAFLGCTSLTSVTIPKSVESIEDCALGYTYDSENYEYIKINGFKIKCYKGTGLKYAKNNRFSFEILDPQTPDYKYEANDDGENTITITDYIGAYDDIKIPSEIDGKRVTSIGESAFRDCESLTSITIPNSVISIGYYAFSWCKSLKSITIPNSVTSIGDWAFSGCTNLTSITIPNSVTSIGAGAFNYCTSLTSVTIPNSVTDIGNSIFEYCTGLTSVTISNSVKSIGPYAFRGCTSLASITIGNSVTNIGFAAFSNCASLTSITIPNSVTSIGNCAFEGTKWLENKRKANPLVIVNNILIDGSTCKGKVVIPNTVKVINDWAFAGCADLKSITIPNGVKNIGYEAFFGCKSLASVTIPSSVTSIGEVAFAGCESLTSITIPDSVTNIGYNAFYGCTSLKSITIPKSVESIEDCAFGYMFDLNSLKEIKINGFKIKCYAGTAGEKYAKDNGFDYELIKEECEHSYTSKVTKAATCTATGVKTFTCTNCGDTYTETIPAAGHKYSTNWTVDKAATCTAEGSKSHHCTVCGDKKDVTVISKTSHSFGAWTTTKSATCTTTGTKTRKCSVCGKTETQTIAKTGHTEVIDKAVSATCTTPGKTEGTHCSKCNAVIKAQETIPATGHKYQTTVVSPTYLVEGYTLHKCSACGDSYKDTITAVKKVPVISGAKATGTTYNSIKLSWNKTSGVDGYIVYRYNSARKSWIRLTKISNPNTTSYTATGLSSAAEYQIAVKGYATENGKEIGSPKLSLIKATTNPGVVSNFKASGYTTNSVKLTWNKVNGAEGYIVYRYNPSNNGWIRLTKTKGTSYTATGLASGTSYKFAVKSYITLNGKEFGGSKLTQVFTSTNPDKVNFTVTSPSAGRATLNWSKVRGATGYIVYYKANAKDSWHRLTVTNGTSYTKTGLKRGNNYIFTVKAYRNAGGKTFNGVFSNKSVKIK